MSCAKSHAIRCALLLWLPVASALAWQQPPAGEPPSSGAVTPASAPGAAAGAAAQDRAGAPGEAAAAAPAPPAPAPSRKERARLAQQDADVERAARQVMALVDDGKAEQVWEGASAIVKRLVPRSEFVEQVAADRKRLGPVLARGEPSVDRERYPAGGRVPQGEYLNVSTPTRFANTPVPVRELVSFRLDEDRVWRVSGYSVR